MIMDFKENEIKLSFVGDILPSNMPYTVGFGNYEEINELIVEDCQNKPNIFFGNLESPILNDSDTNIPFSGNPQIVGLLKKVGINIVSIANNHILEQGKNGFYETIQILRDNGIKVVGINQDGSSNIECFSIRGRVIAFGAFNTVHDIVNPGLYADLTEEAVTKVLARMVELRADFKILSVHWGNEYYSLPNPRQLELAQFAMDQGCDLIIGHHPHVVQKVEIIDGKYVFYSLGNAYFDYLFSPQVRRGLRVDGVLDKNTFELTYYYISTATFGFSRIKRKTNDLILSCEQKQKMIPRSFGESYTRKIRIVRFLNRILMKVYLFKLFTLVPNKTRSKLLKNIYTILSTK